MRPRPFKQIVAWLAVVLVSFVTLLVTLGSPCLFGRQLKVGDICGEDISASRRVNVVDLEKTQKQKESLRRSIMPVFKHASGADERTLTLFNEKADEVKTRLHDPHGQPVIQELAADELDRWQSDTTKSLEKFLSTTRLYPDESAEVWKRQFYEYLPDTMRPGVRNATAVLVAGLLNANMVVDDAATQRRVNAVLAHAQPVTRVLEGGAVVVHRGDVLTAEQMKALQALHVSSTRDVNNLMGTGVALVCAFALFGVFLHTYAPHFFYSPGAIGLMATICVLTSSAAAFIGHQYPQYIPLPATVLTLSIFFGRRISAILTLLVLVFLKVADLIADPELIALGSSAGVALAVTISRRKDLLVVGLVIGFVQALGYLFATILWQTSIDVPSLLTELFLHLLGGVTSAILAMGTLPILETMFGLETHFRIAELTEPDQPLLQQLQENAPGTYQHSLAVANLSEAGARAIGADTVLVRAGAMYHDIGKMVKPKFFIENQLGAANPHDQMQPEDSRARVLAHVTDGLELARKYKLPQAIQDFIPEHQGTTVMAYFYHKACLRDGVENVTITDYRYPGPKPHSRESAIVMLADVSEAVTHSMRDPSQEEVDEAIAAVFKARWEDGQFSESGLTAGELEAVKKAFVHVWRTLHHERLKYPSTTTGRMPVPPADLSKVQPAHPAAGDPSETAPAAVAESDGPGGCCG